MPDSFSTVLALPLLLSMAPLASVAIIAAIAVLVYEVRGLFRRSGADPSPDPAPAATPPPIASAPAATAVDRIASLRAETRSGPVADVPPMAPPATGLDGGRPSDEDAVTAATHPEPAPTVIPPTRASATGANRRVDGQLALAGSIVVGLALLWLVMQASRPRRDG